MIKTLTTYTAIFASTFFFAQKVEDEKKLVKEYSDKACDCISKITLLNKQKSEIINDIHSCIDKQAEKLNGSLLIYKMSEMSDKAKKDGKSQVNIYFDPSKNSKDYKENYDKLERYMMENCPALKKAVASSEISTDKLSKNKKALEYFDSATNASSGEKNYPKAIQYYQMALKEDPKFLYAWENLGIAYRKNSDFNNAIIAYKKAIEIDPKSDRALQNLAIAYIYKKEYQKAIDTYLELDKAHPKNPEVFYGIGRIYANDLKDDEKALDYMAKAYNIYVEQKSPYRVDAESIINNIQKRMNESGKTNNFNEIMSKNKIKF